MILYGYSKQARVLMPSLEEQFLELDTEHESLTKQGLAESKIEMRMKGYWMWKGLREIREDIFFFHDRDEALFSCQDNKDGHVLAINIPDDVLVRIAKEEHIEQDGKEVVAYRIPAVEIGKLDTAIRKEFFPLAGLREHEHQKKETQEERHRMSENKESFFSKLDRLFHR